MRRASSCDTAALRILEALSERALTRAELGDILAIGASVVNNSTSSLARNGLIVKAGDVPRVSASGGHRTTSRFALTDAGVEHLRWAKSRSRFARITICDEPLSVASCEQDE